MCVFCSFAKPADYHSSVRVLRERRQGDAAAADRPPLQAGFLRLAYPHGAPPNPKAKWRDGTGDDSLIRDCIAEISSDEFCRFNDRAWTARGFYRGNSARERI
jgi:hypothetical protein